MRELETAGLVRFDQADRVLQVVGAIENDPPRGSRTVAIAFARDLRELPQHSSVTEAIRRDLERVIAGTDFERVWREAQAETGSHSEPHSEPQSEGVSLYRDPGSVDPRSVDPLPPPSPSPRADFRAAWLRLRIPPFAAAAAEDYEQASKAMTDDEFGALIEALGRSKWVAGPLNIPPTLRRLVDDRAYRQRILNGEFAAPMGVWRCAQCTGAHPAIETCPPKCRGCDGHHPGLARCRKLYDLEQQEENERRQADARARVEAVATERGLSYEDARAALQAEDTAARKAMLQQVRQRAFAGRGRPA
jgi:hypothetical protein